MREIKFRGKALMSIEELDAMHLRHNNGWVIGNVIVDNDRPYIVGDIADEGDEYIAHEWWVGVDPKSVGEFTGLLDKNGFGIYEGDIIKREFEIGDTIYDPNTLAVEGYEITDSGYFVGVVRYRPSEGFVLGKVRKYNVEDELVEKKSAVKIYAKYAEVIGNQFEHPELLKAPDGPVEMSVEDLPY